MIDEAMSMWSLLGPLSSRTNVALMHLWTQGPSTGAPDRLAMGYDVI